MNRIRKINDALYQVLITPDIPISPDSALLIGNWTDTSLTGYCVETYHSLSDALSIAYNYPDIDWYKIVLNHQYIAQRLSEQIKKTLETHHINAIIEMKLMTPNEFKNTIFDRVLRNGERFNLRSNFSDLISFTITDMWTQNVIKMAQILENSREYLFRDDLRLRDRKIIDGKIIILYGVTEQGTTYMIRLLPTLLKQWVDWVNRTVCVNEPYAMNIYEKFLKQQQYLDHNNGLSY